MSELTFMQINSKNNLTTEKKKKKKSHLMSLKNERILMDISENDEKILR